MGEAKRKRAEREHRVGLWNVIAMRSRKYCSSSHASSSRSPAVAAFSGCLFSVVRHECRRLGHKALNFDP